MPTILLAGCAIIRADKILLIKKKDKDIWELPGGTVPTKKDIEQAAVEKTKGQIGVEPQIIQQFTILEYQKAGSNTEVTIFECDIDPEAIVKPGDTVADAKWLSKAEIEKEKVGDDVKSILDEF